MQLHAGAGYLSGLIWRPSTTISWSIEAEALQRWGNDRTTIFRDYRSTLTISWNDSWETRLAYRISDMFDGAELAIYRYY